MMKLGFVSAILPELTLEEVLSFASETGYECVELMCWPKGKAERRYAGVTHVDAAALNAGEAQRILAMCAEKSVSISGLGYYPNPLCADRAEGQVYIDHLKKVIDGAKLLGVGVVNSFIGRDHEKTVDENWPRFLEVWEPLVQYADGKGIRIGIENCPMSFTRDEWPGGKNLATSPAIWRRMFRDIPNANFGLNYDPSHLVWQGMDYLAPMREFAPRLHHMHAKDATLDRHRLNDVGALAFPGEYHTPKLPGLGEIDWGKFCATLGGTGYDGPICVEVEDRVYEGALESRKAALRQSFRYLKQFLP